MTACRCARRRSGEPARRLVPVAGQHPEQPADDDGRQLRGDGGESALGLRPQQRRAVWSALWRWPAHLHGCPTAASGAGTALSAVWPVRDAQRAVDRRADLNLRIFFDSSSVEVFVNDGEACLSSRIYPQAPRRELALFAWSGAAALTEAGAWQLE